MDGSGFAEIIAGRLNSEATSLTAQFASQDVVQTRHFVVDDLLPAEEVDKIYNAFSVYPQFRRLETFRERKFTSKDLRRYPRILSDIIFAFQAPEVVDAVGRIAGFSNQVPDPHLYAGGLSAMVKGDFLNPHIDNSHDKDRRNYRTLNLLYYVSPDWTAQSGGNFELWDQRVKTPLEVVSKCNRLLVMETNAMSWHSVNQVKEDRPRCCVSNYYFAPSSTEGYEHFHITRFSARPEQKFRRLVAGVDAVVRTAVRAIVKRGLGKSDIYFK